MEYDEKLKNPRDFNVIRECILDLNERLKSLEKFNGEGINKPEETKKKAKKSE